MTDEELIKRCAEAINLAVEESAPFDPLNDDADAFILIEELGLDITCSDDAWLVDGPGGRGSNRDLKRAIVECAANPKR